jgi:hypothetical protein
VKRHREEKVIQTFPSYKYSFRTHFRLLIEIPTIN